MEQYSFQEIFFFQRKNICQKIISFSPREFIYFVKILGYNLYGAENIFCSPAPHKLLASSDVYRILIFKKEM